jgi:hypothetical protein
MLIFLKLLQVQNVTRKAKLKYNQSRNHSCEKQNLMGMLGFSVNHDNRKFCHI